MLAKGLGEGMVLPTQEARKNASAIGRKRGGGEGHSPCYWSTNLSRAMEDGARVTANFQAPSSITTAQAIETHPRPYLFEGKNGGRRQLLASAMRWVRD